MSEDDRCAAFIAAARALFVEGGYAALTTNAVAARAKASKRSLYEAFESIDALFAAVVAEHSMEMLREPPDDDAMPLETPSLSSAISTSTRRAIATVLPS
ncbi:helix-turn-helix domain-containing protein [Methylopila sp. Yamaguchi]|uniref:helix-turn-helix domain-containing protein n=1 Tax=Methylopila sp. Yamaguchi TaxID=1437817 RepID=UPI000CCB16FE|nr:helix-turn-helix domain-containing protein [Methylopila sp. Yamaguchi]GBD46788.1 hypothetical protein METY_0001 [Methylopila sp. Yamaguchi]